MALAIALSSMSGSLVCTEKTTYISPLGARGSVDLASCGRSRETPCNGLASVLNASCEYLNNRILTLLPGQHTLPVFGSSALLQGCSNFSLVADLYSYPDSNVNVTIDPQITLNGTFNRTEYHSRHDVTCGLEYAPGYFGKAGVTFLENTNVLLKDLAFTATNWQLDLLLLIDKGDNFTLENCRFLDLPSSHRAVGIFNPIGAVNIVNSTIRTHEVFPKGSAPFYFSQFVGHASLYILATYTGNNTWGRVDIVNCDFIQTCNAEVDIPTFADWKSEDRSSRFTW